MIHVRVGSTLAITGLTGAEKAELLKASTLPNPAYLSAVKYSPYSKVYVPKTLTYAKEYGNTLHIPRGFPMNFVSRQTADRIRYGEWEDHRVDAHVHFPEYDVELRSGQEAALNVFREHYKHDQQGTALCVMPTGSGKTVGGLIMMSEVSQRTLILCKTTLIAEQWANDINMLWGGAITPGLIKASKWADGEHVTIVSWQTANRRPQLFTDEFEKYGMLIIDECHTIPAAVFGKVAWKFRGVMQLGLTGTLNRSDGLGRAVAFHFGEPLIRLVSEGKEQHPFDVGVPLHEQGVVKASKVVPLYSDVKPDSAQINGRNGMFNAAACDTYMAKNSIRNTLITTAVLKEYNNAHHCLIVVKRREHAHILANVFSRAGVEAHVLLGGTPKKDVQRALDIGSTSDASVIISTVQYIGEGTNIPVIDRIFLAVSFKSKLQLEQVIGRASRQAPGKSDVIIYDVVDWKVGPLLNHFVRYRIPFYRDKLGVEVQFLRKKSHANSP